MAEVTVQSTFSDQKHKRVGQYRARQFRVIVLADGDTFTTGIRGIREVFWKGTTTGYSANPRLTNAETGEITFDVPGVVQGDVLILSKS